MPAVVGAVIGQQASHLGVAAESDPDDAGRARQAIVGGTLLAVQLDQVVSQQR